MKNRRAALLLLLLMATFATACSRGVSVGSATPGGAYTVSITNSTASTMDVSYNDGSDHTLGTVAVGRTERFVVAGSRLAAVTVTGRASNGRSSGPYQVQLAAGSTPKVTLR